MTYWQALWLSILEGVTEFLPVSSTGHLILLSDQFGIGHDPFVKSFNIIIQSGAIAAVVLIYWKRFLPNFNFYKKLFVAFLPAAILGLLFKKRIDVLLESVTVVAWSLIIGGVVLIWLDKKLSQNRATKNISQLTLPHSLYIGFIQCLAFIPGVSRSGASIMGGLFIGLNKKEAAEFSFFLAVPTLAGATVVKAFDAVQNIQANHIGLLAFGLIISFAVAWLSIKTFIAFISRSAFTIFGIYRIALGIIVLFMQS